MSEDLLETFHHREEAILHSLLRLQALRHNYRAARLLTGETREMIYSYLKRQDDHFYTMMTEFYRDNRSALKMIEFLTVDIKEVRVATFAFFEQYGVANPLEQGRNFARDLRQYKELMINRFRIERDYLLPLLKRISQNSGQWLVGK
ncbi:MAG: hypothetical protein H6753_04930 [Candidatus Omnitrophica bacterium]|nr:hypothetical protein [Candidatus Omnitrophota bacterium]